MKLQCDECELVLSDEQRLTAPNPFDSTEVIFGCPRCKNIGAFSRLCDMDGCESKVSCGFPTPDGYRHTCGTHYEGGHK